MNTLLYTPLMALTLGIGNTFAQEAPSTPPPPFIEVVGHAEKELMPNEIYIAITLRDRTIGREKITVMQQEEQFKLALNQLAIPLTQLSVSDANAQYVKINWAKKDVVTHKDYVLLVPDAPTVAQVFAALDSLHIVDAHIARVHHSEMAEHQQMVRIMAIKAAKAKADYLLQAIGSVTGTPLVVTEQRNHSGDYSGMANVRGARSNANYYYLDGVKMVGNESKPQIQFKKITLTSRIYVKFNIK